MKPSNLVRRYEEDWQMATRHPFLDAVRYGKLDAAIFATWLVQDYLFVKDEFSCQARLLARAPRRTQKLLLSGLQGLEAELTWFEVQAWERDLALDAKRYPATAAYDDFL